MTATLLAPERMNIRYFRTSEDDGIGDPIPISVHQDGTGTVEHLAIFRAGTFKDSMGIQHTWEPEHLAQLEFHFRMLKDRDVLPLVPVRADHSISVQNVVGWITGLTIENNFLYADFKVTEPDAVGKIQRGTFRNRSAEIGIYETNDEAMFWPVLFGFAFVDMGAVEGLHHAMRGTSKFSLLTEGDPVAPENQTDLEWVAAASYAQGLADAEAKQAEAVQTAVTAAVAEHQKNFPPSQPAKFRVNGQETQDFTSVQSHITTLETFRDETTKASREEFVKQLAKDGKIAATQIEGMTKHALTLSDDQYDGWKATYEGAPVNPLFGNHGNGNTNPDGDPPSEASEVETLEEMVAMHRRAGMSDAALHKTPSWVRLQELKASGAK